MLDKEQLFQEAFEKRPETRELVRQWENGLVSLTEFAVFVVLEESNFRREYFSVAR